SNPLGGTILVRLAAVDQRKSQWSQMPRSGGSNPLGGTSPALRGPRTRAIRRARSGEHRIEKEACCRDARRCYAYAPALAGLRAHQDHPLATSDDAPD